MKYCINSRRCGKSLCTESKIIKYINNGDFPSWVLDIYHLLNKMGLKFIICGDENKVWFDVLYIPKHMVEEVFQKTKELNLVLEIHSVEEGYYVGHPIIDRNPKIKFQKNGEKFKIREPMEYEDINKILYTLERKI